MSSSKAQWDAEALASPCGPDATDALLSKAIEAALAQGKGWKDGEKQAYMSKYFDDDYLHPLFATTEEELDKSGMREAFEGVGYDEPPAREMGEFRRKGNEAFQSGRKNKAKNVQYYRDAINHYYEAFMWAERVAPIDPPTPSDNNTPVTTETFDDDDVPTYTTLQISHLKSTLCSNAALAHLSLSNWGHCRDDSTRAITHDPTNLKAHYRLARAQRSLQNWEEAGDAVDRGLALSPTDKDLSLLGKSIEDRVRRARADRARRERKRAQRVSKVKEVWRYCKENGVTLGRTSLVATVTDDEEGGEDRCEEGRWHHHHPHTGCLPQRNDGDGARDWPCMLVYPSHNQSDFVERFAEVEMLAMRMAEIFPETEEGEGTAMPWDYNDEFHCSKLAIYFEVHCTEAHNEVVHPECVERLKEQKDAMRFYESSRALKGDEGTDMANLARLVERKHLHQQRKAWKAEHGSLWAKPDPCQVVRVHPAATLRQVITDKRMVVSNFMVTFIVFPEDHPAHQEFLKEHRCLGIIDPEQ